MGAPRWWDDLSCDLNGVFKGGGAKGVLYAGALQACVTRGHWFRAVAGSSAGAITAALVASGVHPNEIGGHAAAGLSKLSRNFLLDLMGRPFINTSALEVWLEELLVAQVTMMSPDGTRAAPGMVTFTELHECTGIELYVVCVNVAERQPTVFNHHISGNLSVTQAVIASSSIPLAFRPSRLRVTRGDTSEVHRLMDGGVWANYPDFVFRDPSFAQHHGLNAPPAGSLTLGFVLQGNPAALPTPSSFEPWAFGNHKDRGAGLRGWLRNPLVRFYFLVFAPLIMVTEAMWTTRKYGLLFLEDAIAARQMPSWLVSSAQFLNGFFTHFTPGLWAILGAVVALALFMLLLGATVMDSGLSALRTLMAVGTDVPYWTGAAQDDHVVRLSIPEGLGTFSFKIDPARLGQFIDAARSETDAQLLEILG